MELMSKQTFDSRTRESSDARRYLTQRKSCLGFKGVVSHWLLFKHHNDGSIETIREILSHTPFQLNCCLLYFNIYKEVINGTNQLLSENEVKTLARLFSALRPNLELWTMHECFAQKKMCETSCTERQEILETCVIYGKLIMDGIDEVDMKYLELKIDYRFQSLPTEVWAANAINLANHLCNSDQYHKFSLAKNILLITETIANFYKYPNVVSEVNDCWVLLVLSVLKQAVWRHQLRTAISSSSKGESKFMEIITELDYMIEDELPTKFAANSWKIAAPLAEPNKYYEEVKACYLAISSLPLNYDVKEELIETLRYFDELRLRQNKWDRQSKWHRRKFAIAQKCQPLEGNPSLEALTKLRTVCFDMLICKTKLFERSGGQTDAKLIQKMAFYGTSGISANLRILEISNIDINAKIETLFSIGQFYTKLFSPNKDEQMGFAKEAIDAYRKVEDVYKSSEALELSYRDIYMKTVDTKDMLERQLQLHIKSIASV